MQVFRKKTWKRLQFSVIYRCTFVPSALKCALEACNVFYYKAPLTIVKINPPQTTNNFHMCTCAFIRRGRVEGREF